MYELPPMLRAKDVSKHLNISLRYAYEIMERNDFPTLPIGRLKRVSKEDFLSWIDKQKKTS